jgi:hypothetical protein
MLQGFVTGETNPLEKILLANMEASEEKQGYTRYISLYSPVYHEGQGEVVVMPEIAGLVSLGEKVVD